MQYVAVVVVVVVFDVDVTEKLVSTALISIDDAAEFLAQQGLVSLSGRLWPRVISDLRPSRL